MQLLFRIAYSLVVAILFVLSVILGIRTFYEEPEAPSYPVRPPPALKPGEPGEEFLYCDSDGRCFKGSREVTPDSPDLTGGERLYIRDQQRFYQLQRDYEDERTDYHRNVFVVATVLGVAAVGAGLHLYRRVEALPLGLLLGGFGVVIFAWAQAAEDFDRIGMAPLFATVAVGLAVVLAAGYWLLGLPKPASGGRRGADS